MRIWSSNATVAEGKQQCRYRYVKKQTIIITKEAFCTPTVKTSFDMHHSIMWDTYGLK